ncbi:Appr-1-p processing domain protein [Pseudodesulfovibrio mercurii]|uniref:Appr-1-p processing domain protein n=1 Tax=Pseudodesulfovibrio mercurii TaxID=641491 RepID=F0JKC3_9BACT|nr:macro domain-containing protein [Pseudodesulfovibrio mercurii]EGB16372.1 Appr-1-p processing domain protein [Pseudodesulfovibrio mercurii]
MQRTWSAGPGRLSVREGDITRLTVDAVVNAANSRLAGGGGVDGAIHRAAGIDRLQAACREIIREIGSLPPGEAVITPGFGLPARHIIHTVGPIWRGGANSEPELLGNAYRNSLALAHRHDIQTLAFPAISCGVYGYPVEDAARIALTVLKEGIEAGLVIEAVMVLHGEAAYDTWSRIAEDIL